MHLQDAKAKHPSHAAAIDRLAFAISTGSDPASRFAAAKEALKANIDAASDVDSGLAGLAALVSEGATVKHWIEHGVK